jgi:predicted acylesterase/phospholipase RssA
MPPFVVAPSRVYAKPDTLVIGGGGMRGIHGLGALARLHTDGHLADVKHVVGTSSGAILGYAFVTNQLEHSFGLALRQKPLRDIRIDKILTGFGIDSGRTLDDFLRKLSKSVGDITFAELFEASGLDLHVTVTNLTKRRVEYFCAEDTPNASVVDAVRNSCTVPGLFCVLKKDDDEDTDIYVDGGLIDNFPMERGRRLTKTGQILGICYENDPEENKDIADAREFLAAVFETITNPSVYFKPGPSERVLVIQSERITLDFGADVERRIRWFVQGATRAEEFIKKIE